MTFKQQNEREKNLYSLSPKVEHSIKKLVHEEAENERTEQFSVKNDTTVPLKGLSHEIDFKIFDKNLQNLA